MRVLRLLVAAFVAFGLTSCSKEGEGTVIRAERTAAALDGGATMRQGGRLCLSEDQHGLSLRGCWEVRPKVGEADPEHDYFIWLFRGEAQPDGPRKIRSLEAMIRMEGGEVAWWNPSRDLEIDQAQAVDASYRRPDAIVANEYNALPGSVHPYVDDDLFSVKWSPKRASTSENAGIGAVVEWAVPEGRTEFEIKTSLEAVVVSG